MTWEETREKHKKLLIKWRELRKEIDPLAKICLGKELKPGEDIKPTFLEVLKKWSDLRKQEKVIFDEIVELYKKYYQQKE